MPWLELLGRSASPLLSSHPWPLVSGEIPASFRLLLALIATSHIRTISPISRHRHNPRPSHPSRLSVASLHLKPSGQPPFPRSAALSPRPHPISSATGQPPSPPAPASSSIKPTSVRALSFQHLTAGNPPISHRKTHISSNIVPPPPRLDRSTSTAAGHPRSHRARPSHLCCSSRMPRSRSSLSPAVRPHRISNALPPDPPPVHALLTVSQPPTATNAGHHL